jgi:regulatory protein
MGVITALEVQKRNKKRVSVFIDEVYAFSVSLDEAARLRKGQVLSEEDLSRITGEAAITVATDSAARFLSVRPRSEQEVRQNLAKKETPPAVIEAAIERLTAFGYLDDRAFADLWVRDRLTYKPTSPRALRYELRQKGIANDIVEMVLADLDAEDSAYRAAQAQSRRLRGTERREFQKKLGAFLQRRGFSYDVVRTVLRRLIQELDADDPEFFAGPESEREDNTDMLD